jgi:two-component system, NtrC family, response regulator HydG
VNAAHNAHQIPRVLVVDDQVDMAETVAEGLFDFGFEGHPVSAADEASARIREGQYDALVTDLRIPGTDGLELLALSRASAPERPVIVMTAFSGIDSAVESIRRGAYHYMTKPFKVGELALFLRRAIDEAALRHEAKVLRSVLHQPLSNVVGDSHAMQDVFEIVRRVADSNVPVLVLGETGTGKGLIARAIHAEGSRANEAFVSINCAAIPEALLESELFGHVRGAFTGASTDRVGLFEQAHRGTLFLDEIAEMAPALQSKLLHILETGTLRPVGSNTERKVDVRIVAATHRDLRERVEKAQFREDLFYRLDVVSIDLPALRDRMEDIPALVAHFLATAKARNPRSVVTCLSPQVMEIFMNATWRGNVRELEHVIERLVLLGSHADARESDLPNSMHLHPAQAPEPQFGEKVLPIRELQRRYASWALQRFSGAKMATCDALGIDSKTLAKWLRSENTQDTDKDEPLRG